MARLCTCFIIFELAITRIDGNMCEFKTESGQRERVCCADFEAKDDNCIFFCIGLKPSDIENVNKKSHLANSCSKGYTSRIGQNCSPCSNNTYGERCRYDCSCSVFQTCDVVEGCVEIKTMTGISMQNTTTLHSDLNESTKETDTDKSEQGHFSTEMILNVTLSVIVGVFGVGLCVIFCKYQSKRKRKNKVIIQASIPSMAVNTHTIGLEDRVYEIINDVDVLGDQQLRQIQMQLSSDYLDAIHTSNSTGSGKSKVEANHTTPSQYLPSADTTSNESKLDGSPLASSVTSSSSGQFNEDTTQDYLNPYQPVIKMTPPRKAEYLTLATVHMLDKHFPVHKSVAIDNK